MVALHGRRRRELHGLRAKPVDEGASGGDSQQRGCLQGAVGPFGMPGAENRAGSDGVSTAVAAHAAGRTRSATAAFGVVAAHRSPWGCRSTSAGRRPSRPPAARRRSASSSYPWVACLAADGLPRAPPTQSSRGGRPLRRCGRAADAVMSGGLRSFVGALFHKHRSRWSCLWARATTSRRPHGA